MKRFLFPLVAIALLLTILLWPHPGITNSGQASVTWLSAEDTGISEDFAQVMGPTDLHFPKDLGPHNDYQTEWWYYTGNLETEAGREFGYQLTFFRRGLTSQELSSGEKNGKKNGGKNGEKNGEKNGARNGESREAIARSTSSETSHQSDWRSNQIYFSHFTISDVEGDRFYPHERFSRESADLSGATAKPYRVWLEDWSATELEPGVVRLQADAGDVALDLTLNETLAPVLQGNRGYSQKGPEPGNASYYYSIVQQQSQGTVTVGDKSFDVTGLTWKDHEYSTSALSPGTVGWDWFSLQLDDGSALMLYGLRKEDGTISDLSNGTYVATDGTTQTIAQSDWVIDVRKTWHSPTSGADYPAQWHVEIPKLDLVLDGASLVANQELNISTTYWEGAVGFKGTVGDRPISAKGYVEMTGYADRLDTVL